MTKAGKKTTENITDVEAKVIALDAQVTDLDLKLRTALADYQNLRKELERQHELQSAMIKKRVFADLIEIFTDLSYAVDQLPTELKENPSINGIAIIMSKYKDLLKNHAVEEITYKEGDEYNSALAEVLGIVTHETFDHKVAQTIQPGYKIGEVLIRPARVMIYKKGVEK